MDYSTLTDDLYDDLLMGILEDVSLSTVMQIPGVYELVREHFNNDVLELWEQLYGEEN